MFKKEHSLSTKKMLELGLTFLNHGVAETILAGTPIYVKNIPGGLLILSRMDLVTKKVLTKKGIWFAQMRKDRGKHGKFCAHAHYSELYINKIKSLKSIQDELELMIELKVYV